MEFKFHAVDNVQPAATSHSLTPLTYLPHPSLQMDGGFSGFRPPLTGEEALRRELEKEVIRREILRRRELEEEVRRELAIERGLGISTNRPLNIHGLVSQCSNSTVMNPSREISVKDKVIVLAKPDPELYNAKRKAAQAVSETEPCAFGLKKKPKEEWSCALCEIKATNKTGLNAHLNGKKHKIKEAQQNKKTCKSNITSEKIVNLKATQTDVIATNEKELAEVMVCNDVTEPQNEKSECVDYLASNKDAATEEVEKKSALTKRNKVESLWCEICHISTFSKAVMEGHIKGKKHMKKMKFFEQNSNSPSTCSISTKAPKLIKDT